MNDHPCESGINDCSKYHLEGYPPCEQGCDKTTGSSGFNQYEGLKIEKNERLTIAYVFPPKSGKFSVWTKLEKFIRSASKQNVMFKYTDGTLEHHGATIRELCYMLPSETQRGDQGLNVVDALVVTFPFSKDDVNAKSKIDVTLQDCVNQRTNAFPIFVFYTDTYQSEDVYAFVGTDNFKLGKRCASAALEAKPLSKTLLVYKTTYSNPELDSLLEIEQNRNRGLQAYAVHHNVNIRFATDDADGDSIWADVAARPDDFAVVSLGSYATEDLLKNNDAVKIDVMCSDDTLNTAKAPILKGLVEKRGGQLIGPNLKQLSKVLADTTYKMIEDPDSYSFIRGNSITSFAAEHSTQIGCGCISEEQLHNNKSYLPHRWTEKIRWLNSTHWKIQTSSSSTMGAFSSVPMSFGICRMKMTDTTAWTSATHTTIIPHHFVIRMMTQTGVKGHGATYMIAKRAVCLTSARTRPRTLTMWFSMLARTRLPYRTNIATRSR